MKKSRTIFLWLVIIFVLVLSPLTDLRPLSADPGRLFWDILNTPSKLNNVIVSPSEINAIAIGSDGRTFYAIDIPGDPTGGAYEDGKIYRSTDAGVTWQDLITRNLEVAGATLPVWDIAIAPDDPNFIVVVTSGSGAVPRQEVYLSIDGGNRWYDTDAPDLGGALFIADIAVSPLYGPSYRDIAIGTRNPADGVNDGRVYLLRYPLLPTWPYDYDLGEDVISLAFSPSYDADRTLLVVSSDLSNTYLHFGTELTTISPYWDWLPGFPVALEIGVAEDEIIWADIELPSDYNSGNHGGTPIQRIYVSYDFNDGTRRGRICRIDDTTRYFITPTGMGSNGVSSIAYYGSLGEGKLFAAEALPSLPTAADPYQVRIWRTSNPTVATPTWDSPMNLKQPTGGAGSVYANAQIAFSPDGGTVYCGTGTATVNRGTDWAAAANWTTGASWDESAFSVSLDDAQVWNQISLIDTGLVDPTTPATNKLFLTDIAITANSKTIYLASVNKNTNRCDSIWRSTSIPLGNSWERVLCFKTPSDTNEIILRLNPRVADTRLIFFAVRGTGMVWYSRDQGQLWFNTHPPSPIAVADLTLASESTVYLLDGNWVLRGTARAGGTGTWTWGQKVDTCLVSGHTIATPLQNPEREEWVIVGEGEGGEGRVAYANFLARRIEFERTMAVPVPGSIHVLCDDRFHFNKIFYAASDDTNGRIYRWTLKVSTNWEKLEPPNRAFYGLAQQNGVLYGAWLYYELTDANSSGVDRTLYPAVPVPPPLEWDDLTAGLPETIPYVYFTCEPSSLKTSANTNTYLWVIDNNPYDFEARRGCLWTYTDLMVLAGPWALSPAPGELIPVDPVSGRSAQINFRWRQFPETRKYELWLAKDEKFTLTVIRETAYEPFDLEAPSYIVPPGFLEAGHDYYWKVRAREAMSGEKIVSPWSATMYFTVKSGLPVTTPYIGPMPLQPDNGAEGVPIKQVSFSWTQFGDTTKYQFQFASDPAMTKVLVDTEVPTTAYGYNEELEHDTNYYWRVKAIKPIPSDWSPTFYFRTEPAPAAVPLKPATPPTPATPAWVWALVAIVALLYLNLILLIVKKPRYVKPTTAKDMITDIIHGSRNPAARVIDFIRTKLRRSRFY